MYIRYRICAKVSLYRGWGSIVVTEYTGRLVRKLLEKCSSIVRVASRAIRSQPKPLSVTPLYSADAARQPIYPRVTRKGVVYPLLTSDSRVCFEFALGRGINEEVSTLLDCLREGVTLNAFGHTLHIEAYEHRVVHVYDPLGKPLLRLKPGSRVEVVFQAPTLPVNPWKPGSKWKRLIHVPAYLLHVNLLEFTGGDWSRASKLSIMIDSSLAPLPQPTPHVTRVIVTGNRCLPALTGSIMLQVETDDYEVITLLEHVLSHGLVSGIGSLRATGFGAIRLKVYQRIGL